MEADQLKLLARSVGPADAVVAEAGATGLRVFMDNAGAVETVAHILAEAAQAARNAARGPVQLCLMDPGLPGEVEMDLGQEFPLNPQIKGALKSLDGVVDVEEM